MEEQKKGIDDVSKKIEDNINKIKDLQLEIDWVSKTAEQRLAERAVAIQKELTGEWLDQAKIQQLQQELSLIQQNASAEAIAEATRQEWLSQAQKIIELRDIEIEKIESKIEQLETENAEYRNSLATQTNDLQLALNERDRIESLFADKSIRRFAALTNAAKAYAQAARDAQLASNQQALQAWWSTSNIDNRIWSVTINQEINTALDYEEALWEIDRVVRR